MTRISENQLSRSLILDIQNNQTLVNKYAEEVSSGYKVQKPGDSSRSATISQFQQLLERLEGHQERTTYVDGMLMYQEGIVANANDLLVRAQEVAAQAGNETIDPALRSALADEVFQIRDQMVTLANSRYQGRYIYGGADDDDPPYDATTYTNPAAGSASERYIHDGEDGTDVTRTVRITDDLSIRVNTAGSQVFDNAIYALERLGRALEGYRTEPAVGQPDGSGTAYSLPAEYDEQTQDIIDTIDLLRTAREDDVMLESASIAARLRRVDGARQVLDLGKTQAQEMLDSLQNADYFESASNLTEAQTALQASFTVTAQILRQSILNFL